MDIVHSQEWLCYWMILWLIFFCCFALLSILDESPHCYKRLPEVLAEHGDTIRIFHTLTRVGVAMAGTNEFDPYKD